MAAIDICIPVYNGENYLEQALASILEQTEHDYRVVVSDNASTDRTAEILAAWQDRLPLHVVRRERTVPMAQNFNSVLDQVQGAYYMVLCHDDYLYSPQALSVARQVLEREADISAVYCDLAYVSETRRLLATRRFGREGRFSGEEAGRDSIGSLRNMFGIPLLVRRTALGTNRYDSSFRYSFDVDLSWQVSRTSPAWHVPQILIANRYHGGNTTWKLLGGVADEYIRLAAKYGVELTPGSRSKIRLRSWLGTQKKRVFGAYERIVSNLD